MIYLMWCTVRPETFKETHMHWMNTCSNKENVKTLVAVNTQRQKLRLKEYCDTFGGEVIVVGNEKIGQTFASYCLSSNLEAKKEDIIVLASDDFFSPENWDQYLIQKFKDRSGCLAVRDGYHDLVNPDGAHPLTIPIMTFACLEKLNKIIYHPDYVHSYANMELYYNVKELGLLYEDTMKDNEVFEHKHYIVGKRMRDQYDYLYDAYSDADRNTFERRMRLSVEKRLEV